MMIGKILGWMKEWRPSIKFPYFADTQSLRVKQEPKNMITLLITLLCIGFSFLFFKDTEKGWLGFLIMLTKCGNPLIWDAHLQKEVMKSNHFLVESIERKPNQSLLVTTLIFPKLWSPHGLWLPKESSVNTWGTRQLEGTKGTHTISSRNTHISAKLPPPILWSLYAPQLQPKTKPQHFFLKNPK